MTLQFKAIETPVDFWLGYKAKGGKHLSRWIAHLSDGGVLRAINGLEPIIPGGLWHLSVSVATLGNMYQAPCRKATDEEVAQLKSHLGIVGDHEDSSEEARHFWYETKPTNPETWR